MSVSIADWFEPTNKVHLLAFKKALERGKWDERLVPVRNLSFASGWGLIVANKILVAYGHSALIDEATAMHQAKQIVDNLLVGTVFNSGGC